jgi:hypothetical protein
VDDDLVVLTVIDERDRVGLNADAVEFGRTDAGASMIGIDDRNVIARVPDVHRIENAGAIAGIHRATLNVAPARRSPSSSLTAARYIHPADADAVGTLAQATVSPSGR